MENNTKSTALLVMDMQSSLLANLPEAGSVIAHVKQAIDAARQHEVPYNAEGFKI